MSGGSGPTELVVLDMSVLINFLAVRRLDLLTEHREFRFLMTDHVRDEIGEPRQRRLLDCALREESFDEASVCAVEELAVFRAFIRTHRLGIGECAALAVAIIRGLLIAIDDRVARAKARQLFSFERFLGTEDIVYSSIRAGVLTVKEAGAMKGSWQSNYRFKLPFRSFGDDRQ